MPDRSHATAGAAYPRYERLALRLIGINEFVWLIGHTSLFGSQCADGSRRTTS